MENGGITYGSLLTSMEADASRWKSIEVSGVNMEVDGSRWKYIWNGSQWKSVEADMEVEMGQWKSMERKID